MKKQWKKLFVRKDCDLPTAGDLIHTAYDVLWNYTKQKNEYLFIYFKNQNVKEFGDFLSGNSYIIPSYFYHTLSKIVLYSSFPIFWIASYFKLKEKQV